MKNSEIQRLRNLTFITPSMNRSGFILRMIDYYEQEGFPGKILLGDSSDGDERKRIEDKVSSTSLDITYRYFEKDVYLGQIVTKLLKEVETDFIVFHGDDDFLVLKNVAEYIAFLESNEDYQFVTGECFLFKLKQDALFGEIISTAPYLTHGMEMEDALARLRFYGKNFYPVEMSIGRTSTFHKMYAFSDELKDKRLCIEIFPCFYAITLGKVKKFESLFSLRQVHDNRIVYADFLDWALGSTDFTNSYNLLIEKVSESLLNHSDISKTLARQEAKKSFWSYLSKNIAKHYPSKAPKQKGELREAFVRMSELLRIKSYLKRWGNVGLEGLMHKRPETRKQLAAVERTLNSAQ